MTEPTEEKEPGFHSTRVTSIAPEDISPDQLEELGKMRGVETNLVETPDGTRRVVIDVNSVKLPEPKNPVG